MHAFLHVSGQWRTTSIGMGGTYWVGLDYAAAKAGLDLSGVSVTPDTWMDNPITFSDIEACCRLMRLPLEPRHIEVLLAMDGAWLEICLARMTKGGVAVPQVSNRPLTAALVDAMLG